MSSFVDHVGDLLDVSREHLRGRIPERALPKIADLTDVHYELYSVMNSL